MRLNCDLVDERPRDYDFGSGFDFDGDSDKWWSIVLPDFSDLGPDHICKALDDESLDVEGWHYDKARKRWMTDWAGPPPGEDDHQAPEWEQAEDELREYAAQAFGENIDRLEPAMNYALPCPAGDPGELQAVMLDHPLTVVLIDGATKLALQCGGMDFSWEICAAYVALGYRPPAHYSELPDMAGRGKSEADRSLMEICAESLEVAAGWRIRSADRMRERLGHEPRAIRGGE